jgi:hypothetical protein
MLDGKKMKSSILHGLLPDDLREMRIFFKEKTQEKRLKRVLCDFWITIRRRLKCTGMLWMSDDGV